MVLLQLMLIPRRRRRWCRSWRFLLILETMWTLWTCWGPALWEVCRVALSSTPDGVHWWWSCSLNHAFSIKMQMLACHAQPVLTDFCIRFTESADTLNIDALNCCHAESILVSYQKSDIALSVRTVLTLTEQCDAPPLVTNLHCYWSIFANS